VLQEGGSATAGVSLPSETGQICWPDTRMTRQTVQAEFSLLLRIPMNNKQFFATSALLGKHCFYSKYHHLTPTTAALYKRYLISLKHKTFQQLPQITSLSS